MRISQVSHRGKQDADLDITPFMNLMIVLVPVLLLSMVFTRITVVELQLPESAGTTSADLSASQVEVVLNNTGLQVNFPEGIPLRKIANLEGGESNFAELSLVLQELKRRLQDKQADRRKITLLTEEKTPYHQVIAAMDAVRSYPAMVAASAVEAELFPDIAFGDAPSSGQR